MLGMEIKYRKLEFTIHGCFCLIGNLHLSLKNIDDQQNQIKMKTEDSDAGGYHVATAKNEQKLLC